MSLIKIFQRFPSKESCIKHLEGVRWNGIPVCPYCNSEHTNPNGNRHYCNNCKTAFSVTVGTVFHHTHVALQKWFFAIFLILNSKENISSLQLSKEIEVNRNTAWRMSTQIRAAISQNDDRELLSGIVEMVQTIDRAIGV